MRVMLTVSLEGWKYLVRFIGRTVLETADRNRGWKTGKNGHFPRCGLSGNRNVATEIPRGACPALEK